MKKNLYLLLILITATLAACKKNNSVQNINEYDDEQIRNYIAANNISGMQRDATGGDTSGIYYRVEAQGTGPVTDASTPISATYTVKALDGSYSRTDTIINHTYAFLGQYVYDNALAPKGVQLALNNLVKRQGTKLRLMIPSRLAYGRNGMLINNVRIGGNKSLDVTINVVNNLAVDKQGNRYTNNLDTYDDISIQKYITANNLTGFAPATVTVSPVNRGVKFYYKLRTTPPSTSTDIIGQSSIVTFAYRSTLLNGTVIEPAGYSTTGTTSSSATYYMSNPNGQLVGLYEALLMAKANGAEFTIIIPSKLAYGLNGSGSYPAHSCIMYDVTVTAVTNSTTTVAAAN